MRKELMTCRKKEKEIFWSLCFVDYSSFSKILKKVMQYHYTESVEMKIDFIVVLLEDEKNILNK